MWARGDEDFSLLFIHKLINWAAGLMNYIDNNYADYSAGNFGTIRAWYIATKLDMALIVVLGK